MSDPTDPATDRPIPMLDLQAEVAELWDDLEAAVTRVLRSGRFVLGPEVEAFESEVAASLGVPHAVGLNSGTDALVIGLRALGVGPGDEVITTPFSFFATAESILQVGATPVFVDIEPASFNLDPRLLEAAVTPRTKAVLPVHLYGRPAAMREILGVAERCGLLVLEDCAQSFGACVPGGSPTGTLGAVGAFSFYPTKTLGAYGDAGMLTTHDPQIAEHARALRNHGTLGRYDNSELGYNSRLDALQAAILRVKLPRVAAWNDRRREAAARYSALLAGVEGVVTPADAPGHVFHQYTVRLPAERRDAVLTALHARGIGATVYYPTPLDRLAAVGAPAGCVESDRAATEVVSLPLWAGIGEGEQERVVEALGRALEGR